jgi:hypothetical protein
LNGRGAGLGRAQLRSPFRKFSIRLGEGYEFNISKFESPHVLARVSRGCGRVSLAGEISGYARHENACATKVKTIPNAAGFIFRHARAFSAEGHEHADAVCESLTRF